MLSQSGYSKRIDVFYYASPLWDLNNINVTVFLGQRRNTRSCCERKCGCFLVLRKLLFVSFCVVVWVLFSVFSIFCITSLVSATPRNHRKCSCNANKINNTHIKVFDAKQYGHSSEVLSCLSGLYNYVRARRAGE